MDLGTSMVGGCEHGAAQVNWGDTAVVNDDGFGAIAPMAPPGLATNVKVFGVRADAGSLYVTWEAVEHAAEPAKVRRQTPSYGMEVAG